MTILKYKDENGDWQTFSNTTIGNADTLDGRTASENPTAGQIPVVNSNGGLDVDGDIYSNGEKVVTAGEWQSWTPSFTNFSLGNGTINYARYSKIGSTVHFKLKFTLGSTSSISGRIAFTLPHTVHSSYGTGTDSFVNAMTMFRDVSVPASYGFTAAIFESNSSVGIGSLSVAVGSFISTSSSSPFTWDSGDIIKMEGSYEAA